MSKLWVQYSYDDPDNAAVLQTARSYREAEDNHRLIQDGGVWHTYDIVPERRGGKLVNEEGPRTFGKERKEPS